MGENIQPLDAESYWSDRAKVTALGKYTFLRCEVNIGYAEELCSCQLYKSLPLIIAAEIFECMPKNMDGISQNLQSLSPF